MSAVGSAWRIDSPTRIRFGVGALDTLAEEAPQFGERAAVIAGNSARQNGTVDRCLRLVPGAIVFPDPIGADPAVAQVDGLTRFVADREATCLVAIGGGSVLDAAKAASAVVSGGGSTADYLSGAKAVPAETLPVIAVPTTAGTGAELSKGAIITWPEHRIKHGIRGEGLVPRVAIVDPSLAATAPESVTRFSGFDAFAHAVETFISHAANPLTAILSQHAVRSIVSALPRALRDPHDIEARTSMALSAMLMGYNLANASTCLPHRLQYPLGFVTSTPHGLGLAALFPGWVAVTASAAPEKWAQVVRWMGFDETEVDPALAIGRFLADVDATSDLEALGANRSDIGTLVGSVRGNLANDPWWNDGRDIGDIYRAALQGATL